MGKPTTRILIGAVITTVGLFVHPLLPAGISMMAGGVADLFIKPPRMAVTGRDLGANIADPSSPLPVVYGRTRVGINTIFRETTDNNLFLWIVGAVAHGAVGGIDEVYLDGHLAIDATGAAVERLQPNSHIDRTGSFVEFANVWKAYGTDGQRGVEPTARGAWSVSSSDFLDDNHRRLTFPASGGAPPFQKGEIIAGRGVPGLIGSGANYDGYGYVVTNTETVTVGGVPTSYRVDVGAFNGGTTSGAVTGIGGAFGSGSVDYYTPDMATLFGARWDYANARGRGIAFVVLRLRFHPDRFPNGLPKVEVNLRGIPPKDPRTAVAQTVAIAGVTAGAAAVGYTNTAIVQTAAAHGCTEGDIVVISGASAAELNGRQRVWRVVDATHVQLAVSVTTTGAVGGTLERRSYRSTPALCVRDYLTHPVYGAGLPESAIDDAAFIVEANHHEETTYAPIPSRFLEPSTRSLSSSTPAGSATTIAVIGLGGTVTDWLAHADAVLIVGHSVAAVNGRWTPSSLTSGTFQIPVAIGTGGVGGSVQRLAAQPRYSADGVIDTGQPLRRNLEELLSSCRGHLVWQQGKYRIFTRRAVTPASFALTEDLIVGDWEFSLPGQKDQANVVRLAIFDKTKRYQVQYVDVPAATDRFGVVIPNPFRVQDGGQLLRKQVELPFTTDVTRATQIGQVIRRESRIGISGAVTAKEAALACQVDDVIPVTHPTPGWVAQPFWVQSLVVLPDGLVRIGLQQYDPTCYDLDATDETPFIEQTVLPDPANVMAPTGLVASSDPVTNLITLSWTESADAFVVGYETQYKRSDETTWHDASGTSDREATRVQLTGLALEVSHDFQVRAINSLGFHSDWLGITGHRLFLTPAPTIGPAVAEGTAEGGAGGGMVHLPITFDGNSDEVLVYGIEGATAGQVLPDLSAARFLGSVRRHEGVTASAPTWATQLDLPTTASNYKKLLAFGVGAGGRGQSVVQEIQAVDTGTGPSAAPSGMTVTYVSTGGQSTAQVRWTVNDAAAAHRVVRNGIVVAIVAAGGAGSFDDVGVTPGLAYDYQVQAIRNGQTSARASVSSTPSTPTLVAPTWASDSPNGTTGGGGGGGGFASAGVSFHFDNPDAAAATVIYTDGGDAGLALGSFAVLTTVPAGGTTASDTNGALFGTEVRFYLVATRSGYTSSAASTVKSATYGIANG